MNYDRRKTATRFEMVVGKPAEASKALTDAYLAVVSFKDGLDSMEEIPSSLMPVYREAMKAMDSIGKASQYCHQLREMTKRLKL